VALKNFAGKLILGLLAIESGIILVVGFAGAMVWLSAEAWEGGSSDPWKAFLTSWLTLFAFLILFDQIFPEAIPSSNCRSFAKDT